MAAVVTLTEAQAQLRAWIDARAAIASGQSYSIGGRTLTRQDADTIEANIRRWHNTVAALEAQARGQSRPLGSTAAFPAPGRGAGGGIIPADVWSDGRT